MDKKKKYYRKLFRHITEMFPNGDWVEAMKFNRHIGHPSEDAYIESWEELEPIFIEFATEYAEEKGLTTQQLLNLLL